MAAVATLLGLIGHHGDEEAQPVPLTSVAVSVAVRGFVARIKATLTYNNTGKEALQVLFQCPVDESSALYHMEATLDGRTIIGSCLEKKKAEQVYSAAVAAGQTALLVREDSRTADLISLALGNLPPGCEVQVSLSLVCDLKVATDGGLQFRLPSVINPRYTPAEGPVADSLLPAGDGDEVVVVVGTPYSLAVKAEVTGGQPIARIVSPTDPINVTLHEDGNSATISQDGGSRCDHDWGFVVYYSNPYLPHVLVEAGDPTGEGIMGDQVLMINLFPELPQGSYSHHNEVIFIVDRSGSMQGENIQSARSVLLLFLKSLPPGCLFNVISFGSSYSLLFPDGSREYNEESLAAACELHENMEADMGGTEILSPLKAVYSKPINPKYSRQILLLTDGQVYNVDEVTHLANRHVGDTRVFTVGIGAGASTALVKGLARAGGGRAELVDQRDRMQTKVMGLVASMLQSSMQGVSVSCQFDSPTRLSLVPSEPPVIFAGQHLITYARMPPAALLKGVVVSGCVDDRPWKVSVEGDHVKLVHDEALSLHRLAARAAILRDQAADTDESRDAVVQLSVASGVLSRHTALVAVDQDGKALPPRKPKPAPERIPQMRFCSAPSGAAPMRMCGSLFGAASRSMPMDIYGGMGGAPPPPHAYQPQAMSFGNQQQNCNAQPMFGGASMAREDQDEISFAPESGFSYAPISPSSNQMYGRMKKTFSHTEADDSTDCITNEPPMEDPFMQIISSQKFDGSWLLEDLTKPLNATQEELLTHQTQGVSERVFATALAIALLEDCYRSRAVEWGLIVNKARAFLSKQYSSSMAPELNAVTEAVTKFVATWRTNKPDLAIFKASE